MSEKVTRRAHRGKHRKVNRLSRAERRELLVERQAAMFEQYRATTTTFVEELLKADVQVILARPERKWGDRGAPVEARASCNKCHKAWRGWFRRNGTYQRSLIINGAVIDIRVPRLRCACGGTVDVSFSVFAPYERVSLEVAERLREFVALGLTLRQAGVLTPA